MNEQVKIWIDLSLSDLKSSRLLYDNGHYRTSYFFFQQSSEKANKAFAIFAGLLNEKEFKDIQHNQLKIYRKTFVKQESEIKSLIQDLKPFPEVTNHKVLKKTNFSECQKSLMEGIRSIDKLTNYDLVNISTTDLNFLLKQIEKVKNTKIKTPKNFETVFKTQMLGVADWIGQFGTHETIKTKSEFVKLINDKEQGNQLYNLIMKHIIPFMIDFAFIHLTFYFSAIITIQHSSLTRYPDKDSNPESIYTKRLPLVRKQIDFMNFLEKAIRKLNEINSS